MHIPKSGGSSVQTSLEQAFGPGTISPKRHDGALFTGDLDLLDPDVRAAMVVGADEIAALSDWPVVSGHFSLPTLLRVASASAIATVLREPRARLLSHYAYWRLMSRTARSDWRGSEAMDHALRPLDEFLTEPLLAAATDNLVCRILLGDDRRIPSVDFIAVSDVDGIGRDAIAALETLGFVGVLELGDTLWRGLSRFFGVPLSPLRVNPTASYSETADAPAAERPVTYETLELLDARTAADAIVYRDVLLSNGCSAESAERVQAAAFAAELVLIGNLIGSSATASRARGRSINELRRQLQSKDDELRVTDQELQRMAALLHQTRQELVDAEDRLRCHGIWLDGIQRSASWRLTAPVRAAKRTVMRLVSLLTRLTAGSSSS